MINCQSLNQSENVILICQWVMQIYFFSYVKSVRSNVHVEWLITRWLVESATFGTQRGVIRPVTKWLLIFNMNTISALTLWRILPPTHLFLSKPLSARSRLTDHYSKVLNHKFKYLFYSPLIKSTQRSKQSCN